MQYVQKNLCLHVSRNFKKIYKKKYNSHLSNLNFFLPKKKSNLNF